MVKLSAPNANRLALRLRSWHAQQGDPLPLDRCRHVVSVLYGHVSWVALQAAARTIGEPDACTPDIARLQRMGYTVDAAERLVAYLSLAETPVEA